MGEAERPPPARGRQHRLPAPAPAPPPPRPLQQSFLLKELQVKADPDLPGGDLVQQESPGGGAFAFLFGSDLRHRNLSPAQEIWG